MVKKLNAIIICLAAVLSFTACSGKQANENMTNTAEGSKIRVSVTFNAIKEFVEAVGKDKVEVSTIIPDGMEPHDFEPKAQDLIGLTAAQVFVYNGFGMEAWVKGCDCRSK